MNITGMNYRLCEVLLVLVVSGSVAAEETSGVKGALAHRIIDPQLPLEEVQAYTESRVLPFPDVRSLEEWERFAEQARQNALDRVVFRGEAARWRDAPAKVEWMETIAGGPGYRIRKLRYEALPRVWVPAVLYEPEHLTGKAPVVLNVSGHGRVAGKSANSKQIRCINLAKRGMLALNPEWFGMGQLNTPGFNHSAINQIDLCGASGVAVHFLAMKRGIDVLLSHEHADSNRVAVAGLSGGGWQSIFIGALDPRVTLANPVAGYSGFRTRARHLSDLGDSEQTPVDLAVTADYAHLTAMRAPRPTLLTFNAKDECCFRADHALQPLLDAAVPVFRLYGKTANLRWHVNENPGTHNFELDNRQQFYRMLGDHFFAEDSSYDPAEIPSEGECKTKEQLQVDLPDEKADFHTLAVELCRDLPRNQQIPSDSGALRIWQTAARQRLMEILRLDTYEVQNADAIDLDFAEGTARAWRLKLGGAWTVPVSELAPKNTPEKTVIVLADHGRQSAAQEIEKLLQQGARVVAVDPFYFGESKIPSRDFLFGLLVSAVGKRPLGIQAAQVVAIARWAKKQFATPIRYLAVGPRTSLIALTAAALEPVVVEQIELRDSFASLKEIVERNLTSQDAPELFCSGLLEQFDIPQLAALAGPTHVEFSRSTPTRPAQP